MNFLRNYTSFVSKKSISTVEILSVVALVFVIGVTLMGSNGAPTPAAEIAAVPAGSDYFENGFVTPASCALGYSHWYESCAPPPPPPPTFSVTPGTINIGSNVTVSWQCFNSTSASGGGPFPGPGTAFSTGGAVSGSTVISGPEVSGGHQYQLQCSNSTSAQRTVTAREPEVWIRANPKIIQPGETSVISWSAYGVNSCTVSGPGISESAPPPDLENGETWTDSQTTPPLDGEAIYRIACETPVSKAQTIVNVVPEGVEI